MRQIPVSPTRVEALEQLAPLSVSFTYAPELGLALAERLRAEWLSFVAQLENRGPSQVEGLAFLAWLEATTVEWRPLAYRLIGDNELWQREIDNCLTGEMFEPVDLEVPTRPLWDAAGIVVFAPPECALHVPEMSRGLEQVDAALPGAQLRLSRPAEARDIHRVHSADLLTGIDRMGATGGGWWDPETASDPMTPAAVRAASGALITACRGALETPGVLRVCAVRPGSHHAGFERPMGTCLVNHLAVAAAAMLSEGIERVAILDWDAHHGNGTQEIFWDEPRVLTISIHQVPLYPGSGLADERGGPGAIGSNLNLPMQPGQGGVAFRERIGEAIAAIEAFAPELVLVEASSDAHWADPASDLMVDHEDFSEAGARLGSLCRTLRAGVVFEAGAGIHPEAYRQSLNAAATSAARALARPA